MSLLNNLPHRCTIEKRVQSRGTGDVGGIKAGVSNVSTDVECWEQPASNREIMEYDKKGMIVSRKVYFKSDPGVTEQHHIKITSRDRGVTTITNPATLEVRSEALPDASAGLNVVFKVMVDERSGVN